MIKRLRHFVRGLHAAYLKKRFAALDRDLRRLEIIGRQLRASRRRVSANIHRVARQDSPFPEITVCAGSMRISVDR